MFNLPNLISITRIPLAFCFIQDNPLYRSIIILAALLTDGLDGFLARRYQQTSRLGTLIDPFTDKFFVILTASVLIAEGKLNFIEICMLICRDFSVLLFGFYLLLKGRFSSYRFRAIWCGKITTVLQFTVLFGLVWNIIIPPAAYGMFIVLGILALFELYYTASLEPNRDAVITGENRRAKG